MALVKFYRGVQGASLPAYTNGAIFVVANGDTSGDIYVDVDNGKRLKIRPNDVVTAKTTAEWNAAPTTIAQAGQVYVYTDYSTTEVDGKTVNVPGIKVGDGSAYLIDMPFLPVVTQEKADFWDDKVTAYMDDEHNETLILSKV